ATLVPCQGHGLPPAQSKGFSVPMGLTSGTLEAACQPAGKSSSGSNPVSSTAIPTASSSLSAKSRARQASATPISRTLSTWPPVRLCEGQVNASGSYATPAKLPSALGASSVALSTNCVLLPSQLIPSWSPSAASLAPAANRSRPAWLDTRWSPVALVSRVLRSSARPDGSAVDASTRTRYCGAIPLMPWSLGSNARSSSPFQRSKKASSSAWSGVESHNSFSTKLALVSSGPVTIATGRVSPGSKPGSSVVGGTRLVSTDTVGGGNGGGCGAQAPNSVSARHSRKYLITSSSFRTAHREKRGPGGRGRPWSQAAPVGSS